MTVTVFAQIAKFKKSILYGQSHNFLRSPGDVCLFRSTTVVSNLDLKNKCLPYYTLSQQTLYKDVWLENIITVGGAAFWNSDSLNTVIFPKNEPEANLRSEVPAYVPHLPFRKCVRRLLYGDLKTHIIYEETHFDPIKSFSVPLRIYKLESSAALKGQFEPLATSL